MTASARNPLPVHPDARLATPDDMSPTGGPAARKEADWVDETVARAERRTAEKLTRPLRREALISLPQPGDPCSACGGRGWAGTGTVDEFGNRDAWTCDRCEGSGVER